MWSHPLKNFPFEKIKRGQAPIPWGYPRLLIRSHAPHLSRWRPSSAVYQLGGYELCFCAACSPACSACLHSLRSASELGLRVRDVRACVARLAAATFTVFFRTCCGRYSWYKLKPTCSQKKMEINLYHEFLLCLVEPSLYFLLRTPV